MAAHGELERALALTRVGDGEFGGVADRGYVAANGMFGGWTAAVLLRAVGASDDSGAVPSVLSVNYVSVIEPGVDVRITTRRVGGGRSVGHWQAELTAAGSDEVLAFASVVLASRRESDGRTDVTMPDAPDAEGLKIFRPPGTFGERTVIRTISGFPPFGRADTRSTAWVREESGRGVDHAQLAYLSDLRPPRSFYWSDGPRPSATFTLAVWFHATEPELAAVGDDDVLSEAFGARGIASTSEEHLRLWSRAGALLATSVQMAWYR